MFLFDVDEDRKLTMLRAMHAVAQADGAITPKERALLEVSRDALRLDVQLADLAPLDLAEAEGEGGERIVQAMILMAIMDGAAAPEEAALVKAVADRAKVDDARVANLRHLAEGRVKWMRFDLTRKGYAKDELARTAKEEGLAGVYRTFGPILGLAGDPELARKYIALGEYPAGTVGRAYFDLITKNDLSFPGEPDGLGERGMWHDMLHVAGGYPVDPIGEAEVVAFMAGFRKEDPFFWLFTVALQFQVGVVISPFAPGVPDQIDPRRFVLHHKRGALVKIDLSTEWRFEEDWEKPLAEVQARLGVVPLEDVVL
ncbi:MAG: hypothetical protein KIT84_32635 [Labilithrix sp.]|nr:hypothetical protein [Labilithrix sp.]MCW5815822.1 hypothetical protein [Labilithrix sp.]